MDIDILYLVGRLENLISTSRRVPLTNQILIKEADILSIIDQMQASIPNEVKQARAIVHDKDRILAQAQADANKLVAQAQEKAEEADGYVAETLRALRDHLTSIEMDIDRSILSIEKGLASLELPDEEHAEDMYDEEIHAQANISSQVKTKPRSASLAADTIGGPAYQQDSMHKKQ